MGEKGARMFPLLRTSESHTLELRNPRGKKFRNELTVGEFGRFVIPYKHNASST